MGRWDKESKQVLVPPRVWGVPPPGTAGAPPPRSAPRMPARGAAGSISLGWAGWVQPPGAKPPRVFFSLARPPPPSLGAPRFDRQKGERRASKKSPISPPLPSLTLPSTLTRRCMRMEVTSLPVRAYLRGGEGVGLRRSECK